MHVCCRYLHVDPGPRVGAQLEADLLNVTEIHMLAWGQGGEGRRAQHGTKAMTLMHQEQSGIGLGRRHRVRRQRGWSGGGSGVGQGAAPRVGKEGVGKWAVRLLLGVAGGTGEERTGWGYIKTDAGKKAKRPDCHDASSCMDARSPGLAQARRDACVRHPARLSSGPRSYYDGTHVIPRQGRGRVCAAGNQSRASPAMHTTMTTTTITSEGTPPLPAPTQARVAHSPSRPSPAIRSPRSMKPLPVRSRRRKISSAVLRARPLTTVSPAPAAAAVAGAGAPAAASSGWSAARRSSMAWLVARTRSASAGPTNHSSLTSCSRTSTSCTRGPAWPPLAASSEPAAASACSRA